MMKRKMSLQEMWKEKFEKMIGGKDMMKYTALPDDFDCVKNAERIERKWMRGSLEGDRINKEIAFDIINGCLPEQKKKALENALTRNLILTSARVLEVCDYAVYKEGWYFKFYGTRCSFNMFVKDNDGEFEIARKPIDSKLNKLYYGTFYCDEADFR